METILNKYGMIIVFDTKHYYIIRILLDLTVFYNFSRFKHKL